MGSVTASVKGSVIDPREISKAWTDGGSALPRQCWATIRSGLGAGLQKPADLSARRA
jgi:hypothetical protein